MSCVASIKLSIQRPVTTSLTIPSLQYRKDSQWIKPCNADFDEAYWGPITPPVPAATLTTVLGFQNSTASFPQGPPNLELKTIRPHFFSCMYGTHFCASWITAMVGRERQPIRHERVESDLMNDKGGTYNISCASIGSPSFLKRLCADLLHITQRPDFRPSDSVVAEQDVRVSEALDDLIAQLPRILIGGQVCLKGCGTYARGELDEFRHEIIGFCLGLGRRVMHRDRAAGTSKCARCGLTDSTPGKIINTALSRYRFPIQYE